MKYIQRELDRIIPDCLRPGKVCLVMGSRRTGKTVLLKKMVKEYHGKSIFLNAEDMDVRSLLAVRTISNYRTLFSGTDLLVIDEAQTIPDIGQILKLIIDEVEGLSVLASGSSSFGLHQLTGEPLTGRSITFQLFPVSVSEFSMTENPVETRMKLMDRLLYGSYPELLQLETADEKKNYLNELINSYLLKDILAMDGLRSSSKLFNLLRLIAYQTGKEVSYNEIGKQLGFSKNTVEKYLDLLSKVFIIFRLGAYSKNLRKEIVKSQKWYFIDNGIRNAILSDFTPFPLRKDTGGLWENYVISERLKRNSYRKELCSFYFWRTYDQQEIDLIEEKDQQISAIEIKWNEKPVKPPVAFRNSYPDAGFRYVNPSNYLEWIM